MSLYQQFKNIRQKSAFKNRINTLRGLGHDITIYEDGVGQVSQNLENGAKSLVVYGEPQSGKTEVMIALVCRLLDDDRKTIFVIMNNNTELENQNFLRFMDASEINPSPMTAEQFLDYSEGDKKSDVQRVIFCRKNASLLRKLITETRFLKDRLVIDDEADYASPDSKINKETDPSVINDLVQKLGQLPPKGSGTYIGVTATPGRLDLNGTFANDSENWVFLRPHAAYKGREFFFPITSEQKAASDYILTLLPDTADDRKALREAVLRFLVRTAILNLSENKYDKPDCYSMLIHTEGRTSVHEEDQAEVNKYLSVLVNEKQPKADSYVKYMLDIAETEISTRKLNFSGENVLTFILHYIGKSSTLIINHRKDKKNVQAACEPKNVFTFAFGGNIISRGLTFKRLLTFYFSRNVKNKLQQNTYIQRARMFGNRPYSSFFELCVPNELFSNWADCFIDHEISLNSAKAGDYVHIAGTKTSPSDSASIDKSRTQNFRDEWLLGSVVKMPTGIEEMFNSPEANSVFLFLNSLLEKNIISNNAIHKGMLSQIKSLSEMIDEPPIFLLSSIGEFIYPAVTKILMK